MLNGHAIQEGGCVNPGIPPFRIKKLAQLLLAFLSSLLAVNSIWIGVAGLIAWLRMGNRSAGVVLVLLALGFAVGSFVKGATLRQRVFAAFLVALQLACLAALLLLKQ